jgi:hypothetical protein
METTISKTVKGATMESLFDNCELFSIRYFNSNEITEDEYNPENRYKYEIRIRHAEGTDANVLFEEARFKEENGSPLPSAPEEGKLVTMLDSLLDLLIKGDVTIKSKSGAHWDLDELNQNLKDMYEALKEITRQYEITATTLEAEFNSHFDIKDYPSIQKAKSILSRISKQQNF